VDDGSIHCLGFTLCALAIVAIHFRSRGLKTSSLRAGDEEVGGRLGLTREGQGYSGTLGGRRVRLCRVDGELVLRVAVPTARWLVDLAARPEASGGELGLRGMRVAWGQTDPHRLHRGVVEALAALRALGAVACRDQEVRLWLDAEVDVETLGDAIAGLWEAFEAQPSPLGVALDAQEPADLRERCYQAGIARATDAELVRLLTADRRVWVAHAAVQLRHAETLLQLLRMGVEDYPVRSLVEALPEQLSPAEAADVAPSMLAALARGMGPAAESEAVVVLLRHGDAVGVDALLSALDHVSEVHHPRLRRTIQAIGESVGRTVGQLAIAEADEAGAVSVVDGAAAGRVTVAQRREGET